MIGQNEKEPIDKYLAMMSELLGKSKLKFNTHMYLQKIIIEPPGLKWGLVEAIKLRLDKFAKEIYSSHSFIRKDKSFVDYLKNLAI